MSEKITVKLLGEDGNVFNLIGKVRQGLRRAGRREDAEAFVQEATSAGSYDEVLQIIFKYVEVE